MSLPQKLDVWVPRIFGLGVLCWFAWTASRPFDRPYNDRKFDAARWGEGDLDVRTSMVDDLLENHLKAGQTRQQVERWLGPPALRKEECWLYKVVTWGSPLSDDAWVRVDFDASDRVVSARLYGY